MSGWAAGDCRGHVPDGGGDKNRKVSSGSGDRQDRFHPGAGRSEAPDFLSQKGGDGPWTESDDYKQQTKDAVEGAGIFPLIGSDKYILMYDVYMKGKYQFTESTDLENFKVIDHAVSMDFHPRHGTVIPITEKELKRLYKVYGKPTGL